MKKILLVEPDYKNKYPPLGLMKIATYHKQKGHSVFFAKGFKKELKKETWDRIYISTLFTFYWTKTIKTIKFYLESVKNPKNIFVGGVMASLMKDKIKIEFRNKKITVVEGLLDRKGKLRYRDDKSIDHLTPDYSIIDPNENIDLGYTYPTKDSYIGYATRGCIRKCPFCAVPFIEPYFHNGISVTKQVSEIREKFGEKRNLLLMDNNILASSDFSRIIDDIKMAGFFKGAKFTYLKEGRKISVRRYVDFNQGVDARLLDEEKMKKISELEVHPLRIAFDNIKYKDVYIEKVKLAAKLKIKNLSNYILFNFKDTPDDFYERLRINIELNEEFKKKSIESKIWSFPMKFSPIFGDNSKTRDYVGTFWNRKYLRGIQCILIPTHGVVGPNKNYFEKAFGKNAVKFKELLLMPEEYIIQREKKQEERRKLTKTIKGFNRNEFSYFLNLISENKIMTNKMLTTFSKVNKILDDHYNRYLI